MAGLFRHHRAEWLTGSFHFFILLVAIEAESAEVWPWALGAMAMCVMR